MSSIKENQFSEKELIIEIKNDNRNAFQTLFYSYYKKLLDFSLYRTRDLETSKDLVQEVFSNIWDGRDRLDPTKSIKSYLYKSLTNQIINLAKHSSSKTFPLNDSISHLVNSDANSLENSIDLFSAIEELPVKLKTVFMLSRIEGFKYSEIAEICDISVKAVEKRMTKALKFLRKKIGE